MQLRNYRGMPVPTISNTDVKNITGRKALLFTKLLYDTDEV